MENNKAYKKKKKYNLMEKKNNDGRFWLAVVNKFNLKIIKKEFIMGFDEKLSKKIRGIKKGDKLIFYVLGKKLVGTYDFCSKQYIDKKEVFISYYLLRKRLYPLRYKIKLIKPFIEREISSVLINQLSFIKNKVHWGGSFQGKAVMEIDKEDFNKIMWFLYED